MPPGTVTRPVKLESLRRGTPVAPGPGPKLQLTAGGVAVAAGSAAKHDRDSAGDRDGLR